MFCFDLTKTGNAAKLLHTKENAPTLKEEQVSLPGKYGRLGDLV